MWSCLVFDVSKVCDHVYRCTCITCMGFYTTVALHSTQRSLISACCGIACAGRLAGLMCAVSRADFGASGEEVEVVEVREYVGDPAYGTATTQLYKVSQAAARYMYMCRY